LVRKLLGCFAASREVYTVDECERYDLPISLDFRHQILTHIQTHTHHIQSIMGIDLMCVTENYDKISWWSPGATFFIDNPNSHNYWHGIHKRFRLGKHVHVHVWFFLQKKV